MSAAIHPFPGRDPHLAVGDAGDDLLAELAAAVGSRPIAAGQAMRERAGWRTSAPVTPARGVGATVSPIGAARRGGANDLVATERLGGASVRRHHLVLVAVSVALALAMAVLTGVVRASAAGDVPVAGVATLEDGQTLWGLAEEITPADRDVRDTVALLFEVNDFDSPTLPVGTVVHLPDLQG